MQNLLSFIGDKYCIKDTPDESIQNPVVTISPHDMAGYEYDYAMNKDEIEDCADRHIVIHSVKVKDIA